MGNSRLLFTCLAFLLIAPATSPAAHAQGARGLPDPVSSAALERLLEGAGITDPPATLIDEPMARYLAAMETLRSGRIEAWLERRREGSGMFESPDPDLIRAEIEDRRRLLSAIAALDRTLFSELTLAGLDPDAIERAVARRTRDRAHAVIGRRFSRGIRIEPSRVLATVAATGSGPDAEPAWIVDDAARNRVLDHDRIRTGRLERLADLVIDRPLRIAEAMRDVVPPDLEMMADDPEAMNTAFKAWFDARRAARITASKEARALQAGILQADTTLHDELTEGLREGELFAIALDRAWRKATLPSVFPDRSSPERLFTAAKEAAERGLIDAEAMTEIRRIEASWRIRHAEIETRLIRAVIQEIREGDASGDGPEVMMGSAALSLTVIGSDGEMVVDASPEPTSASQRLVAERTTLDREVRDRLEAIAPKTLARRDAPSNLQQINLGGDGVMVQGAASIMIGAEAGVGLDLADFDELGPAMEMIGGLEAVLTGGGEPMPRPVEPAAYDLILRSLGLTDPMRPIAESLYADYRAAWEDLDEELVSEWRAVRNRGPMFTRPGEAPADPARAASLHLRILDEADALDVNLFRDLGALVDDGPALKNAERRRRREIAIASIGTGTTPGSSRLANLDLERILAETVGTEVASMGLEYDLEVTSAQFERAKATIEIERDLKLAEMKMFAAFERPDEDGGMVVDMTPDPDAMSDLERLYARRAAIDESMRSRQIAWRDRMAAAIPPDQAVAFLLEVDRAAHPRCFRDPDSPESRFEKALSLVDLTESQRSAIRDLETAWRAEWIAACRKLVAIDARARVGMTTPGLQVDMSMFAKASADRKQVRFARTELDERTVRSLLSILTPAQAEAVEEARRSESRIEELDGLNGFQGLDDFDAIEGGAIFIGG